MATIDAVLRVLGALVPLILALLAWIGRGDSEKSRLARVQREIETFHALPEEDAALRRLMRRRLRDSIRSYDQFIKRRPARRMAGMALFLLSLALIASVISVAAVSLMTYKPEYVDSAFLEAVGSEARKSSFFFAFTALLPMGFSILMDPQWDGIKVPGRAKFNAWREARIAKQRLEADENPSGSSPEDSGEVDRSGV